MFYERLKAICEERGTTITAVVRAVSGSTGSVDGWKKGRAPSSDIVVRIAKYLEVSTDYLLGLSDTVMPSDSQIRLVQSETALISNLRNAEPIIREAVLRMASAVLEPNCKSDSVFLHHNDGIIHHSGAAHEIKEEVLFDKRVEGDAAAGIPITAVPDDGLSISVPEKYLDERYFIIRARGDSMTDIIPNGAYCVFQRDSQIDDGCIVLAQIDGQTDQPDATIKRIYRHKDQIELRSENQAYMPMYFPAQSVHVSGRLVTVLPQMGNV